MRDTGVSRRIDELGRFVLPSEIRKSFGLKEGDFLDIAIEDGRIILSVRADKCVFCRMTTDLREFQGKMICARCIGDLTSGREPPPAWEPFSD